MMKKTYLAGFGLCLAPLLGLACGTPVTPDATGGQPGAVGGAASGGAPVGGSGGVPVVGSGGTSGSGGAIASTGGMPASGGAASGGSGGGSTTGGLTDLSGKTLVSCNLTITSSMISPTISTVGIVEFSSELAGAESAFIQFGETTTYSLEAPVDLTAPNYRTLLLGMTTATEYHYRVAVVAGAEACVSDDQTITTGAVPAGGGIGDAPPSPGPSNAPIQPGFILNGTYNSDWLYILNDAGELVWYFPAPFANVTRSRLSWDGKYMWARDGNPGATEGLGKIAKIAMDGSSSTVADVPTSHHDLSVLPDGSIIYIRRNPSGDCDAIYKHAGDGVDYDNDTMLFDVATAFSGGTCHSNSLHYQHSDGGVTISDLDHDAYVKVSSSGELEWVLGGGQSSDFSGEGATWERQHGHHLLADDLLLFFNNGAMNSASPVREVSLDLTAMTASFGFTYSSTECDGNCLSQFMGDVQRLPNGNTFVTYSSMGIAHEVDPDGMLIRSFELPAGPAGYTEHRPTLYGPPPR
jgi:hypothetical protein